MMSRTVRYMKLLYIVAGILMSNESVCETVDQIQITPRVEVKEILRAPCKRLTDKDKSSSSSSSASSSSSSTSSSSSASAAGGIAMSSCHVGMSSTKCSPTERPCIAGDYASRRWFERYLNAFGLRRIRQQMVPWLSGMLNVWAIPNYLLTSTSSYISRKLLLSHDCDMIYNK